jgi:DNA-binding NarL/FixJ family response regulator
LKLLIADDHQLIREGLRYTLEEIFDDLQVVEASDGEQVMNAVSHHRDFDLILLDFYMPGTDGYTLLSSLCDRHPRIPVVVISGSTDLVLAHKLVGWGASGFISKLTDHAQIVAALQIVLRGGTYLPRDIDVLDENLVEPRESRTFDAIPRSLQTLTRRQFQVLKLIAKGKTNKDISRLLNVAENTVKVHVTAILRALGVSNRTQAVLAAQKSGLS